MKTLKILFVSIIALTIIYYQLDKFLFYYGKNDIPIYHPLPFKIVPEYKPEFEGGFALRDKYEVAFAANGIFYLFNHQKIFIKEVLAYGFDSKEMIVVVKDSTGAKYTLRVYSPPTGNPLDFKVSMYSYDTTNSFKFTKWINIGRKNYHVEHMWIFRNIVMFILIIMIPIFLFKILIYARKYKMAINNS